VFVLLAALAALYMGEGCQKRHPIAYDAVG